MENFTESRAWAEWYISQLCGPGPAPLDAAGGSEAGYVFAAATPSVRAHLLTLTLKLFLSSTHFRLFLMTILNLTTPPSKPTFRVNEEKNMRY